MGEVLGVGCGVTVGVGSGVEVSTYLAVISMIFMEIMNWPAVSEEVPLPL